VLLKLIIRFYIIKNKKKYAEMITTLNKTLRKFLKVKRRHATREKNFLRTVSRCEIRVNSEVSSNSVSLGDDCLKTSLNYSGVFPSTIKPHFILLPTPDNGRKLRFNFVSRTCYCASDHVSAHNARVPE